MMLHNYVTDWSLVITVVFFPELLLIGYHSKILNRMSDNRLARCLGGISYDLYLWNFPILVMSAFFKGKIAVNTSGFIVLLIILHLVVGLISNQIMKRADPYVNLYWKELRAALCSKREEVNR